MRLCWMVSFSLVGMLAIAGCNNPSDKVNPEPPRGGAGAVEERGFVTAEIKPGSDNLFPMIQAEVKKARSQGLKPFVEFWASWCEPCMAIKHSLTDARMKAAFKGVYIIQINADEWQDAKLAGTGFVANSIPVFYEVGDDGKPTGRKIDGGAWGDNIPANMAPPLDKFFHGS